MNIENIQRVIDHLKTLPPERFDMRQWAWSSDRNDYCTSDELNHNCGTTGCIAGWAVALLEPNAGLVEDLIWTRAQRLFGLDNTQSCRLFVAQYYIRRAATRDHAIQVLEHMVATGEIDWERVMTNENAC